MNEIHISGAAARAVESNEAIRGALRYKGNGISTIDPVALLSKTPPARPGAVARCKAWLLCSTALASGTMF